MDGSELLSDADREFIRDIAMRTKADNRREAAEIAGRLERARIEARSLALGLSADREVKRVFFFGSAWTGRGFRLDSDIDLAVEGGDILSHIGLVEGSAFSVDVVDFLALPALFRARIESEGELLYAKRR
jgi:predicted nucleotidyltransferase